ncbi:hypothetical protein ACJX0J_022236, partial [Zea mays]
MVPPRIFGYVLGGSIGGFILIASLVFFFEATDHDRLVDLIDMCITSDSQAQEQEAIQMMKPKIAPRIVAVYLLIGIVDITPLKPIACPKMPFFLKATQISRTLIFVSGEKVEALLIM